MKIKEHYIQKLEEFEEILSEHSNATLFIPKIVNLKNRINTFAIKVPLIGRFSAGKSRLLNTYLGQNILEWNDSPTTAVATELKFGESEKIIVHYEKDKEKQKEISELKSLETEIENINYIEIYLDNSKLKERNQIVLVDMPGIDSNNYQHTKAIARYIENGHYFIAVAAPLDAFNDRLLQFIDEFANYDYESFSFILTRKKSSHNLVETQKKLSILLQKKYNSDIFVGATEASKLGNDITDFEKSLEIIYNKQEKIFLSEFEQETNILIQSAIDFINNKLKGSNLSGEQIDITIQEIEKLIDKNRKSFNLKMSEIENDITNKSVSNIIAQATSAIRSNSSLLGTALKSGTIENQLENIVRPIILNGFKQAIHNSESKLVEKLGAIRSSIDSEMNVMLTINTSSVKSTEMTDSQQMATQIVVSQIAKPLVKKTVSKAASLATQTGFATAGGALGTFVGPIGTLVGIVVGELVAEFFLGMTEKKNIEKQINNEVIPQAIQNTATIIRKQAIEIFNIVKNEYVSKFEELEREKLRNLTELKNEKEKSKTEFEENIKIWNDDLAKLVKIAKG